MKTERLRMNIYVDGKYVSLEFTNSLYSFKYISKLWLDRWSNYNLTFFAAGSPKTGAELSEIIDS
jgi:hypothetical protein